MEDIFNFFVVFYKNLLKDVHKSIMREFRVENNPTPSRLRGRGVEVSKTLFCNEGKRMKKMGVIL